MKELFEDFKEIVLKSTHEIRTLMHEGQSDIVMGIKKDGDLTRNIDIKVENIFLEKLEQLDVPITLITEERGNVALCSDPQYALFLDPVDGSDMAARGYPLCSIAASFYSLEKMQPEFSIIGDIEQGRLFCSYNNNAFLISEQGSSVELKVADYRPLSECMMVNYAAKPSRLMKIFEQKALFEKVGLLLNYGGPMDIARIGEGSVDLFLEFQKGFKNIDYVAGIDIAQRAGAVVTDLQGNPIEVKLDLESRQKFLVSSNYKIHEEVLMLLE